MCAAVLCRGVLCLDIFRLVYKRLCFAQLTQGVCESLGQNFEAVLQELDVAIFTPRPLRAWGMRAVFLWSLSRHLLFPPCCSLYCGL